VSEVAKLAAKAAMANGDFVPRLPSYKPLGKMNEVT
jgi:hypothetical protein